METKIQTPLEVARHALRNNIRRLARYRTEKRKVPANMVHMERQLLFALVHGLVCETGGYSPMTDAHVRWADNFLDRCADAKFQPIQHEEAILTLILGTEMTMCGKDFAAEPQTPDFDEDCV